MPSSDPKFKALAMAWKKAAPALSAARRADIRRQNNYLAIEALNSLFRQSIKNNPPRKTSGFVEMYKVLARQRNGPNP